MPSEPRKGLPRWAKGLIYLLIIGAVGALAWSQLPRGGYPTDLTRIGQGQPALVLAYDNNSMGGMEVMALLDDLRGDYAGRVELLVAQLSMEDGHAFAQRHGAANGSVMLFLGAGAHVRTLHMPNSHMLRVALDEAASGQVQ